VFGEPPRTQADLNFMLFGIPVRVHPLFWLIAVMLGPLNGGAPEVLTWIVAVFFAILVHEMGHALVIRAYGFRPWIVLHGMGGLTIHDPRDTSRSRGSGTLGQILISIAGPAAGFLLIALVLLGFALAGYRHRIVLAAPAGLIPVVVLWNLRFTTLFYDVSFICIFWGLVNLLPIYPLDGGKIAREILLKLSPSEGIRLSLGLSILAAGAMAVVGGAQWHDWFIALFFGYLAYSSYATLQVYSGRNPW
jgi:membrane-associated protease RseP (regulator of RpoE activity)